MPRIPLVSPATGASTPTHYIHTTDCNFVDANGRTLLLRGVNLSGSSKAPVDKLSYTLDKFWETAESGGESFIGRPLNIDDGTADVHLARLRGWGFNMLRFPVTWEALEHEGPGIYDYEFMDYTIRVLQKCKEYGFKVYMDPHQDVWSRFSGGSGAPYWTLIACGMNPRNFTATQAAIIHSEYPYAHSPDPANMPAMVWSTNYGRLASQTLFTLFFAGRDFAPKCIIDGKNIQDYLQQHFIAAMGALADRIRDADGLLDECVIGWDSMNEPFEGLCGWIDLNANPDKQGSTLKKGTYPTPAQSMRLGMGQAQTVDNWKFGAFGPTRDGSVTIDPKGRKAWLDPEVESPDGVHPRWGWKRDPLWKLGTCIWELHGVWDVETGFVMRPDYFLYLPTAIADESGEGPAELEFIRDYWKPHWLAFSKRIRRSHPEAIIFVQPPVFAPPPSIEESDLKGRCVYSPHYYDGLTLVTRHWNWFNADALGILRGKYKSSIGAVKIGEKAIRKSIQSQLGILKSDVDVLGRYPTIIGEIGTPFDMDGKRSYGWTDGGKYLGDYSRQEKALDASLNAADGPNHLNYTIWTFCPDHSHDWGDGWNMEDLSLWSSSDVRRDELDYGVGNRDDMGSQAMLLNKKETKNGYTARAAAVSTLSLATIGLPASLDGMKFANRKSGKSKAAWHDNPLEFLKDGARAVRASSRPWPTKVIGKPKDMSFNINKAEFKLTVVVTSEDQPPSSLDEDKQSLATELFIPLVHFAHPRLLSRDAWSRSNVDLSSQNQSVDSLTCEDDGTPGSTETAPTVVGSTQPELLQFMEEKNIIEVDVQVSDGEWSVERGQTLKWWYDVPKDGEPPREYTIVVKRRGGAIKTKRTRRAWLEFLCPSDGCLIM